jgi:1-deoxy-D-xylulose-5-phosphate reductoisomerase
MAARKRIVLLGATGSIGDSALRVIAGHPDRLELVGIGARGSTAKLAGIARRFGVRHVALTDAVAAGSAQKEQLFPAGTTLHAGPEALATLATLPDADLVLVAVVGTTALQPTLAAIASGKDIALASKEILVMAGKFVMAAARAHKVRLLPVDSEHNALFQCLGTEHPKSIRRVIVTASGGAFRDRPLDTLSSVRPEDALQHPNWSMGPKITVDSATLANKGLEMIEAQWLFGLRAEQVDAVIHPQSIVHGLLEYTDGSILAQLTPPSMTFAIQHTLLHPDRVPGVEPTLDFQQLLTLEFRPVDENRYPCLRHAREAMRSGGTAPTVFNAANEVAVAAFLSNKLPFLDIARVVGETLARIPAVDPASLDEVVSVDQHARVTARQILANY